MNSWKRWCIPYLLEKAPHWNKRRIWSKKVNKHRPQMGAAVPIRRGAYSRRSAAALIRVNTVRA